MMKKNGLRRLALVAVALVTTTVGLLGMSVVPAGAYEPSDCHGGTFRVWCFNSEEGLTVYVLP